MESWTVYILKCSDNKHYIGCTNNIKGRLIRHRNGYINFTRTRLPIKLIVEIVFWDKYKAYNFERYLKTGSGIAFRNRHLI